MLETILQRLLGRYLEPYVYNLSRENLRLGVLSGNLVLENLKLKENLGDILHLPLSIVSGQIGHVSITIPWTSLGYKPLVIKLKEIHVVVRPKDYGDMDEETLRKELREAKEKLIEFKEKRLNERFLNGELSNSSNNPNEAPGGAGSSVREDGSSCGGRDPRSMGGGGQDEASSSSNGTNLLWRIIKKIVANIQLEIQDVHVCMVGFQSNDEKLVVSHSNAKSTRSDIIMGVMIKSGFVVTTDSFGNRDANSPISGNQKVDDPNALFKTVEINDVGVYIGQYFPNSFSFDYMGRKGHQDSKHAKAGSDHHHSRGQSVGEKAGCEMVNIVNVRNKLLEEKDSGLGDGRMAGTLESKYLFVCDEKDPHRSLGAWRLEYILKPLTFHLNISHSPVNNELRGILQVHSITEHTIILRRSHLRPIIFSLQSLNERQERYREILMKNSHLVNLDPVSLRTTTQDEYISLYSRKLRLEAIRLYNSEGNETNFFGVVVQPLSEEELNRLQVLDDVLSVRHITKWRCKAREAINRIIIEASSRKKLRNISSDAKSLQMENGNLTVNSVSGASGTDKDRPGGGSLIIGPRKDTQSGGSNTSWTKWAIGKIIGTGSEGAGQSRYPDPGGDLSSSPSYIMHQRGIYSEGDFTVSSSNGLITEEEMDVIMTAVTNEKYFEKIETPTKFSITFGLAYFGITIFDDVTKPILGKVKSDLQASFPDKMSVNDINTSRNINIKFMESIPNPTTESEYMSLKLHELYIQFNIQSVIDRNDKDCYDWNFSTYINNLSLYHFRKRILFFNNSGNKADVYDHADTRGRGEQSNSMESGRGEIKTPSIYNLGSIIRTISGIDSRSSGAQKELGKDSGLEIPGAQREGSGVGGSSSIFLYFTHNVSQDGNSLKFVLKVSPLEIFITPHFVTDIYSLFYLYNSVIIVPEGLQTQGREGGVDSASGRGDREPRKWGVYGAERSFHQTSRRVNGTASSKVEDSDEFVENLLEKSHNVRYLSSSNSFPDYIHFDIEISSPIFHIICSDFENQDKSSLSSIQIFLGNCFINTRTICELSKLDISVEFSNTQIKYLNYSRRSRGNSAQEEENAVTQGSVIEGFTLNKEFTILHPIPVLLNTIIYNQRKEEIHSDKDNLSIIIKCSLQQFILTINNDTIKYLMHIPLSFYNSLSLPMVMGYYYLPPDTLFVGREESKSKCNSSGSSASARLRHGHDCGRLLDYESGTADLDPGRRLKKPIPDLDWLERRDSEKHSGSDNAMEDSRGRDRESQSKIAKNVLILMNKTMKIECFVKSDIFSFTILSRDEGTDLIQGSIKGISSYLSFDSTETVYQGRINLYRALLYSSLTKKPLLLTVSEYDPVISDISEIYGNLDRKPLVALSHSSVLSQNDSLRDSDHSNYLEMSSFDNDNAFEDAIEDFDSTLDVFFSLNGNSSDEDLLDISIVSSPIEFYWDKPTITSLIDCIKSYQKEVWQIARFHLQTMNKIYYLNKFYYACIEAKLESHQEIVSVYGNTFRLCDPDHYGKLQFLINMRDFLVQPETDCGGQQSGGEGVSDSEERQAVRFEDQQLKKELKYILDNLEDRTSWIHCIILMPPEFNFAHIQRVFMLLNNLYYSSEDSGGGEDTEEGSLRREMDGSCLSPTLSRISLSKRRQNSSSRSSSDLSEGQAESENPRASGDRSSREGSSEEGIDREHYYQEWMSLGLFDSSLDESSFSIGSERVGLPEFSFNITRPEEAEKQQQQLVADKDSPGKRSPKIRLTHIIKGGSLSMIKDEKVYITAGVNNICICMDIFGTGDKMVKISVNNCSLTINGKCILTRHSKGSGSERHLPGEDSPLLLMYISLYSSFGSKSKSCAEEVDDTLSRKRSSRDELNIALKCYMDSICYILYSRDVLEFVEYINDGILDTLISKSYKAAKDMTAKKIFLYYLSISNSVIKLPEDHHSHPRDASQTLQGSAREETGIQDSPECFENYINSMDVFDETLKRYKDTLQDLLQELYLSSRKKRQETQDPAAKDPGVEAESSLDSRSPRTENAEISSYILSRINNRESLHLLEKSISDYPRFKTILYDVELFEGTQSYCEVATRNIRVYNRLVSNVGFIREFYDAQGEEERVSGSSSQRIWTTMVMVKQGVLDIVEKEGGSEAIQGRVLPDLDALVEFGATRSFPDMRIGRILGDLATLEYSSGSAEPVSLFNVNLSPLELSLSRQQLTFVLSVISENLLNHSGRRRGSVSGREEEVFGEGGNSGCSRMLGTAAFPTVPPHTREKGAIRAAASHSEPEKRRKISMLVNVRLPRLSLEASFSHAGFGEKGLTNTPLPLLLAELKDCEIRSRMLSMGDDDHLTSITITSKKYHFDDIRLTSNLRFRRIIHGFTLGDVLCNETLTLKDDACDDQALNKGTVDVINRKLSMEKCSIQFICQLSGKNGSHILLKAFNPRAFFGFNCIVDFYYYLSHSWRSSAFSGVVVSETLKDGQSGSQSNPEQSAAHQEESLGTLRGKGTDFVENEHSLTRQQDLKSSESCSGRLFRDNKENIIQEFELLLEEINRSCSVFQFEFKLEIENGVFGFTSHPQKWIEGQSKGSSHLQDRLILIWETDIDCSITTCRNETIIRNLNLLNSLVYFTEIQNSDSEKCESETCLSRSQFSTSLLKPIFEVDQNNSYIPISFEIPNISQDHKKVIIADTFDILTSGRYLSNIKDIPDIYSTLISLSELIFIIKVDYLKISISPALLSILLEVTKNLFSDGPAISPLYTSTLKSDSVPNKDEDSGLIKQESEGDLEENKSRIKTLGPPPIRRIYDLKVCLNNLNIKLISDDNNSKSYHGEKDQDYHKFGYLPVLNLEMSVPEWRIEIIPIKTNHTVKDANVKISIFDLNSRIWEPILEKCIFSVYYFYDHLILYDPYVKPFKKSHRKYLHSTFSKAILLNVKPSILQALMSYYNYYYGFRRSGSSSSEDDLQAAGLHPSLPGPGKVSPSDNEEEKTDSLNLKCRNRSVIELESLSKPLLQESGLKRFSDVYLEERREDSARSCIKYLNLTGLPYYGFVLKGDKLDEGCGGVFYLKQLFILAPCSSLDEIRFDPDGGVGQSTKTVPPPEDEDGSSPSLSSISLKYINNCNSQIPLLRVSLPNELFCVFSAPIDIDVLRLKREFRTLDIEFIIRVLIVYRSYNLAQNVLKHYKDLSNHNDICNKALGPLPNGLYFTHFQDDKVSSACIDTIIPFHNLYYLKGKISKESETYARLFSDLKLDSYIFGEEDELVGDEGCYCLEGAAEIRNLAEAEEQAVGQETSESTDKTSTGSSLNKSSFTSSISRSFSKSSMKSFQSGIKRNLERKLLRKTGTGGGGGGGSSKGLSKESKTNASYLYKNIVGQIMPVNAKEKLFCLISNHRIVNRTGIPLEICFLNENNIPIQLFDVSKVSVDKHLTDLVLNQEVPNNQSKYKDVESRKLRENSEYVTDQHLSYNEAKSIPLWLNNTDIINTILSSMSQIYDGESSDISDILFQSQTEPPNQRPRQKRFYYSYFLPNGHMMSVPQIALTSNYCKVIFRPCIIGLFEIYNIHSQYNNDSDIDQMLFDKEIFDKYSKLMNKYNDENILNEEFHQITYELLKIFKTSNGEFVLDLYYSFWNNLISRFINPSTELMDLSYLQSRGWTHSPLVSNKNMNVSQTHFCNLYPDFKSYKKSESHFKENAIYFQSYIQIYQSMFPGCCPVRNILLYPSFSLFNLSPAIMDVKVKSQSQNLLHKCSSLLFRLRPMHHYNIYQLSSEMKLQYKVRIMLETNSLGEFELSCSSGDSAKTDSLIFTQWSSPLDLNLSEAETPFTLYCSNNSAIDLKCTIVDKVWQSSSSRGKFGSLFGRMQKNIIALSMNTWFINKTSHNVVPVFENSPFPYINTRSGTFFLTRSKDGPISVDGKRRTVSEDVTHSSSSSVSQPDKDKYEHEEKIYLLNNRHNYLKIYFNSFDNLREKYGDFGRRISNEIYLREEKEILEVINSSEASIYNSGGGRGYEDSSSNIGLLEIPPVNGTYSFPITNDGKVYFFTVKSSLLFYYNDFSCSSKVITISPHIILENKTDDEFIWSSFMFPSNSEDPESADYISQIDPNTLLSSHSLGKDGSYSGSGRRTLSLDSFSDLGPQSKDFVTSLRIESPSNLNISKSASGGSLPSMLPYGGVVGVSSGSSGVDYSSTSNASENNKSMIKDQMIVLFLSRHVLEVEKGEEQRRQPNMVVPTRPKWSQPILISPESNGIFYMHIPQMFGNQFQDGVIVNPKTYCIEIIASNGLFILKIMRDFSARNKWDGVVFTNYCNYLSKICIETYHFEHNFEERKKRRKLSLLSSSGGGQFSQGLLTAGASACTRISDLSDDITVRYVVTNGQKKPLKISWSSPFVYNSRNCRLYIIPKLETSDPGDNDNNTASIHQSLGGGAFGIQAFDMNFRYNQNNPYQSKRYILSLPESDILKLCEMYPYLNPKYFLNKDAKKGNTMNNYPIATISITARNNGLYIDILPPRNHSSLLLNLLRSNNRRPLGEERSSGKEKIHIEDLYQRRIYEINKFVNNDVWSQIYTYYRKITLDISQLGISVISENRESEIVYVELSTIQFKKQEKNRNGIIESYKFIIGDVQIDNQYISSSSKFYVNNSSKLYGSPELEYRDVDDGGSAADADDSMVATGSSGAAAPYVLLANRSSSERWSDEETNPFISVRWSSSNAKSQWETIIYNFDCELSDLELNFDFNMYRILNEFIEECRDSSSRQYILDIRRILSKDQVLEGVEPNMTFSIEKIKIGALNLFVWCSIPLSELNYIPEWFRIGLRILTVSNALELRGAPIKLEAHNLENSIGTVQNIANAFYEYYMAELLWRIGTVLGHSSFVNIPLVPLQVGKNTLNMAFSTISMVNSNITSLLSNLTLDTEYINSRQRELLYNNSSITSTSSFGGASKLIQGPNSQQASSLRQGFVQAGHNLTQGILSLGSVITKPIEGAQKSGFSGFCTGLIKGVTSSVVRPIDHIGQALNNVIDGIQAEVNKPLGGYKQRIYRRRIPRMLYSQYSKIGDYETQDALLRDIIGPSFARHLSQYFVIPTDHYSMPLILLIFPKTIVLIQLMSSFSIGDYTSNFSASFGGIGPGRGGGGGGFSSGVGSGVGGGFSSGVGGSSSSFGTGGLSNNAPGFSSSSSGNNSFYKSQIIWLVSINNIREVKASSHGILIELLNEKRDTLQIPVCKFSLIKEIVVALDNSQNNASPHLVFKMK